jgi:serine/threonine protein kinase
MAARNNPRAASVKLMADIDALEHSFRFTQRTPQVDMVSVEVEKAVIHDAFIYRKAQFNATEPALRGYPYVLKSMNTGYAGHSTRSHLDLLEQAHSLATETLVLSKLRQHPNVRRLHAISSVKLTQSLSGGQDNGNDNSNGNGNGNSNSSYFMVLDVMEETLQDRMQRWRKKRDSNSGIKCHSLLSFSSSKHYRQKKQQQQQQMPTIHPHAARERCKTIGLDTARALAYLHKQDVVYGDLSPHTIGFDASGVLKLSDFSASSSVPLVHAGDAENNQDKRAQDVHMFGWLLWELTTLQTYNKQTSKSNHSNAERLSPLSLIPSLEPLQRLIETCWNATRHHCPSFTRIVKRLIEATMEHTSSSSSSSSSLLSSIQEPVETCTVATNTNTTKGRSSILKLPLPFRFTSSNKLLSKHKNIKRVVDDDHHYTRSKPVRQYSGDTACTQSSDTTTTSTDLTPLFDIMNVRYGISNHPS